MSSSRDADVRTEQTDHGAAAAAAAESRAQQDDPLQQENHRHDESPTRRLSFPSATLQEAEHTALIFNCERSKETPPLIRPSYTSRLYLQLCNRTANQSSELTANQNQELTLHRVKVKAEDEVCHSRVTAKAEDEVCPIRVKARAEDEVYNSRVTAKAENEIDGQTSEGDLSARFSSSCGGKLTNDGTITLFSNGLETNQGYRSAGSNVYPRVKDQTCSKQTNPVELSNPDRTMLSSSMVTVLAPHWSSRMRRNKRFEGACDPEAHRGFHDNTNSAANRLSDRFQESTDRPSAGGSWELLRFSSPGSRRNTEGWSTKSGPASLDSECKRKMMHTVSVDVISGRMDNRRRDLATSLPPTSLTSVDPSDQRNQSYCLDGPSSINSKPTTSSLLLSLRRFHSNSRMSAAPPPPSEINPGPGHQTGKLFPASFHNNNNQDKSMPLLSPSSNSCNTSETSPLLSPPSSNHSQRKMFDTRFVSASPTRNDGEDASFTQQPQATRSQSNLLCSKQTFPSKGLTERQQKFRNSNTSLFSESSASSPPYSYDRYTSSPHHSHDRSVCIAPRRTTLTSTSWWKKVSQEGVSPLKNNDTAGTKEKPNTPFAPPGNNNSDLASVGPPDIRRFNSNNNTAESLSKGSIDRIMKPLGGSQNLRDRVSEDSVEHDSGRLVKRLNESNLNTREPPKPQSLPDAFHCSKISRATAQTLSHPEELTESDVSDSSFTTNTTELPPTLQNSQSSNTPGESSGSKYRNNHWELKGKSSPTSLDCKNSQSLTKPLQINQTLTPKAATILQLTNSKTKPDVNFNPISAQTDIHSPTHSDSSQTYRSTMKEIFTPLGFKRSYESVPKSFRPKASSSLIPTVKTFSKTDAAPLVIDVNLASPKANPNPQNLNPVSTIMVSTNPNPSTIVSTNPNHGPSTMVSANPNPSTVVSTNFNPSTVVSTNPNPSTMVSPNPNPSTVVSANPNPSTVVSTNLNLSTVVSANPNHGPSTVVSTNPNPSAMVSANLNPNPPTVLCSKADSESILSVTTAIPSTTLPTSSVPSALASSSSSSPFTISSLLTPPATPVITSPNCVSSSPQDRKDFSSSQDRDSKKHRSEGKRLRRVTWEDSEDLPHSEPIKAENPREAQVPTSPLPPSRSSTGVKAPSIFSFLRSSSPNTNTYTSKTSSIRVSKGGKYRSFSSDSADSASREHEQSKLRPSNPPTFDLKTEEEVRTPRHERTLSVESGTSQSHPSAPLSLPPDFLSGYKLRYSSPPYSTLMSTRSTQAETKPMTPRSKLFQQTLNYTPHLSKSADSVKTSLMSKPPRSPVSLRQPPTSASQNKSSPPESVIDSIDKNNNQDGYNSKILLISNRVHVGSPSLQGAKATDMSSTCVTETLVYSIKPKIDAVSSQNSPSKPLQHTANTASLHGVQSKKSTAEAANHSSGGSSTDSQSTDDGRRKMKDRTLRKNRLFSTESSNEQSPKRSLFALKKSVSTPNSSLSRSESDRANKTNKKVDQVLSRLRQTFSTRRSDDDLAFPWKWRRNSQTPSVSESSDISNVSDVPAEIKTSDKPELRTDQNPAQALTGDETGTQGTNRWTHKKDTIIPMATSGGTMLAKKVLIWPEKSSSQNNPDQSHACTEHESENKIKPHLTIQSPTTQQHFYHDTRTDPKPAHQLLTYTDHSPGRIPEPTYPGQFRKSTPSPRSPFSPFSSLSPFSPFPSPDPTDDVFYSPKLQRRRESPSSGEPGEGISLRASRGSRAATGPPTAGPGQDQDSSSSLYADLKYGIEPGRSFSVTSVLSSRPSGPGRISTGSRFKSVGDLSALTGEGTGQDLDPWSVSPDWTTGNDSLPSKDRLMSYFPSDPGTMKTRSLPRSLTRRLANWSSEVTPPPLTTATSNQGRLWSPSMNSSTLTWDTEGPPTPPPTPPLSPISRRMSKPSSLSSPTGLVSTGPQRVDSPSSRGCLPSRGYVSSLSTFEESSDSSSATTTDDEYVLESDKDEKETEL
ncbi:mucin-12 isoform X2 [Cheilinus undulatus]|uniref:mucin-12 isoform X2 n=1 Tax=Cheilinus undulatus TaxID=241271 RepID=UPI001BD31DCA|nr:mucin-12 isoform X2 [Cheilinus undulatus]